MPVPLRHLLQQGPVVRSLLSTGFRVATQKPSHAPLPTPSAHLRASVGPRDPALVKDFVRNLGGAPGAWKGVLPPHLFPQWGFPLLAKTLHGVPYDLRKVLNGGCAFEVVAPLPANEPLQLEAWLDGIDDNGSRAVLRQRLRTSTASGGCLECTLFAIVPLGKGGGGKKAPKERPLVPESARAIAQARITPQHARDFAVLTGDVNPVHWIPAYARAAGFKSTILHGFATLGRGLESIVKTRLAGDGDALRSVDVKFVRPVLLPARLTYFVDRDADGRNTWYAGTAPGGPAWLTGTFSLHAPN